MSSAFEEVCTEVRSLLNSSKDQMTISALTKDYVLVMGSSIPFRKLGYQSVEELLRDIPNLRLNRVGKEFYIDMKPDEKTAHIAKLVQEQRSATKKKRKGSRPPPSRTSFNYRGSNNNRSSSFRSNNNNFRSSGSTDYRTNNSRPSNNYNNNRRQPSSQNHYDFNHKKKENEPRYVPNYRSSTRTQYDFSDPEDDYDEMDGFREEYEEPVEKFDIDKVAKDIQNLRFTVNNSTRGAGRGNSSMYTMRGGEIRSPETGPTKNPPDKPRANTTMANPTSIKNSTSFDPGYCDDWDDSVSDTDLPNYSPAAACNDWDDTVEGDDDLEACSSNGLVDVVNATDTENDVQACSCNGSVEVVNATDTEDDVQACSRNGSVEVVNATDTGPKYLTVPFDDWDDDVPSDYVTCDSATTCEDASSVQNFTKPDDCDTVVMTSSLMILDNCVSTSVQLCEVEEVVDNIANRLEEQLSENASHVGDVVQTNGDNTATKSSVRECEVQGTDDYKTSRLKEQLSENTSYVGDVVQTNGDNTATKSSVRECEVQGTDDRETSRLEERLSENTSYIGDVVQTNGDDTAMESSHTPSSVRSVHTKTVDNGSEGSKNSLEEDVIHHEKENVIQCSGSCVRSSGDENDGDGPRRSTDRKPRTSPLSKSKKKTFNTPKRCIRGSLNHYLK